MNNTCLVFLNGDYVPGQSQLMPGITITVLDDGLKIEVVNTPQMNLIENPLMLLYHQTDASEPTNPLHPQLILSTQENVQLRLIEINLSETFQKTQAHKRTAATLSLALGQSNTIHHEFFSYSGQLTREVIFKEKFSSYHFRGLLSPRQNTLAELNLQAQHLQSHCKSNMQLRTTVHDTAVSRFLGQIFIDPTATKTQAKLENKNLLLSPEASCYTQPYLEINTDEIACSHGATVSTLEEEALFYLRSRGISEQAARAMVVAGFIAPVISGLGTTHWQAYWDLPQHPLSGFKLPLKSLARDLSYESL